MKRTELPDRCTKADRRKQCRMARFIEIEIMVWKCSGGCDLSIDKYIYRIACDKQCPNKAHRLVDRVLEEQDWNNLIAELNWIIQFEFLELIRLEAIRPRLAAVRTGLGKPAVTVHWQRWLMLLIELEWQDVWREQWCDNGVKQSSDANGIRDGVVCYETHWLEPNTFTKKGG